MSLSTASPGANRSNQVSPVVESSSSFSSTPIIGQTWFLLDKEQGALDASTTKNRWVFVLPVLLLEFLAIALTRAVLPSILLEEYGPRVYIVLGSADCVRGLLAFFACPLFGKLSDLWGRKNCLLVTVLGTCAPVCSLALFSWEQISVTKQEETTAFIDDTISDDTTRIHHSLPPNAIPFFVFLLCLSGIFSSTFTLVFAYISDTVKERNERVSAFGLALACFGLSFTIGPMCGGYLAQSNTHYVFLCSLVLTLLDILYIYFLLPESLAESIPLEKALGKLLDQGLRDERNSSDSKSGWSPLQSVIFLLRDPFLRKVGEVALFYYTGVWAVISTLSLYAVQRFRLTPERLGELMSALGLCTMLAEAVLVRIIIPWVGEKKAIQIGLISFALQCLVLGAATEAWHLFICVAFSLLGNLVYPSLSSLVTSTVEPESNGEALGAINGVKALTEGIGPLIFGALMTISEDSDFPGWPYWIACVLVLFAYKVSKELPNDSTFLDDKDQNTGENEFIYELQFKQQRKQASRKGKSAWIDFATPTRYDEEYRGLLLSEIEEESSVSESNHSNDYDSSLTIEGQTMASSRGDGRRARLWAKMNRVSDSLKDLREDLSNSVKETVELIASPPPSKTSTPIRNESIDDEK